MKNTNTSLGRSCIKCEVKFKPTGRYQRCCHECIDSAKQKVNRSGVRSEVSKMVMALSWRGRK